MRQMETSESVLYSHSQIQFILTSDHEKQRAYLVSF